MRFVMSFTEPTESLQQGAPVSSPDRPADGFGAPVPRRSTSGLAIASLILGVAGFLLVTIPVNLVLGVVALVRASQRGERGRVLAVIGVTLSVAWAAGLAVLVMKVADSPEPRRDAQGNVTTPGAASPDKLKVGDCVSSLGDGELSNVRAQPCSQPGGGKVFAIFQLPAGSWPGEAAVNDKAGDSCVKRLKATGRQAGEKSEIQFIRPVQTGWRLGDRKVICLLAPAS